MNYFICIKLKWLKLCDIYSVVRFFFLGMRKYKLEELVIEYRDIFVVL